MEFLGFLIIGLVIAILVLPFVALAKANRAKRVVQDLAGRVASLKRFAQPAGANGFGCATEGAWGDTRKKSGSRSSTDLGDDICSRSIHGNARATAHPTSPPRPEGTATL